MRAMTKKEIGQSVKVRHDLRSGSPPASVRATARRSARRTVVRARSSAAPVIDSPGRTNSFGCSTSVSSSSISPSSATTISAVTREVPSVRRSRRSTSVASSAPTTKSSRWSRRMSSASRASVRSVAAPTAARARPSAETPHRSCRRHRSAGRPCSHARRRTEGRSFRVTLARVDPHRQHATGRPAW